MRLLLLELLLPLLELFTACAVSPNELYWVLRALATLLVAPYGATKRDFSALDDMLNENAHGRTVAAWSDGLHRIGDTTTHNAAVRAGGKFSEVPAEVPRRLFQRTHVRRRFVFGSTVFRVI